MTEHEFRAIYLELIDENPLAVRAVLKVLEIEFTSDVPTLAVTCTDAPRSEGEPRLRRQAMQAGRTREGADRSRVPAHPAAAHVRPEAPDTGATPGGGRRHQRHHSSPARRPLQRLDESLLRAGEGRSASSCVRRPASEGELLRLAGGTRTAPRRSKVVWEGLYDGRLCADDIEEIASDFRDEPEALDEKLLGDHQHQESGRKPAARKIRRFPRP